MTFINLHILQLSLTVYGKFFSHFYSNFYFRQAQEDNVRKVVKELIKVIKL